MIKPTKPELLTAGLVANWLLSSGPLEAINSKHYGHAAIIRRLFFHHMTDTFPNCNHHPLQSDSQHQYNPSYSTYFFCYSCGHIDRLMQGYALMQWLVPWCQHCYSVGFHNSVIYTDYMRIPWVVYSLPTAIQQLTLEIILDKTWSV